MSVLPREADTAERPEELELICHSRAFEGFDDQQLTDIAALLQPVSFASGQTIVREGEPADRWYVIAEGTAAITHADLTGQPVTLAVLGPGDAFGERALVDGAPRSATVAALSQLEAFALERADFQRSVAASAEFGDRLRQRLEVMAIDTALKRASPFASLPNEALRAMASQLQPRRAHKTETIVREGDAGDCFYLIRDGQVEVVRKKRRVAILRAGDSFGELALLTSSARSATVRALEETELLALDRQAFEAVAREHATVANYFRELVGVRFRGAPGQPLLLPDPLTTIMPLVAPRRRKRYWRGLLLGMLLFAVLTAIAELGVGPGSSAVYGVMLVGSLIGPIVFVQYLAESNILTERPLELLATAVLGAALGLPPAILLQREAGILPGSLLSALLIALIEEPAKVLGVVWVLRRPALRFRMDGVIFGAAAGMGFAALEIGLYGLARIETVGVLLGVLWVRALLSPFTHGTWTAIVCATIWRERTAGWRRGAWKIVAAGGAAVVLHALWDWRALPMPFNFVWLIGVGVASVLTLRAVLQRAAQEEAQSVAALAPEALRDVSGVSATRGLRCLGCGQRAPGGARYCPRCGLALRLQQRG